jgi:hypothetical protein
MVSGADETNPSRIMAEPTGAMLPNVTSHAGDNHQMALPAPEPLPISAPQCREPRRLWMIDAMVIC